MTCFSGELFPGIIEVKVYHNERLLGHQKLQCYDPHEDLQVATHVYVNMIHSLYQRLQKHRDTSDIDKLLTDMLTNHDELLDKSFSYIFDGLHTLHDCKYAYFFP